MQNKHDLPVTDSKKPGIKGETISELAHRHLIDEHHTTTDEELKNARIELSTPPAADDQNLFEVDNSTILPPFPGEIDNEEDENDKKGKGHAPNPYDLLGS